MDNRRLLTAWLMITAGMIGMTAAATQAAGVDNRLWAELLEAHVQNGVVHYQGFKEEEPKLDRYLETLERTDPEDLSRQERFAFFINVYNAWTIKLILMNYPGIDSIKDIGSWFSSPWKKKIVRLKAGILTLDNIEHDILRPRFKDPRVHFAVNCASKGCPPLRSEPYSGDMLELQLDSATEAFINDPAKNRLEGETLYVSKIFKWFKEDFNDDPVRFFLRFADADLRKRLQVAGDRITVEYLDYDWGLNGY